MGEPANEILRTRVKDLIRQRGLTQRTLAGIVGLSEQSFSGWLKGHHGIGFDKLDGLAHGLGVEVPDLFCDRDPLRQRTVLLSALSGASTNDTSPRRAQFDRLLEEYDAFTKHLLDLAAQGIDRETPPPRAKPPRGRRGPRTPR